MTDIHKVDIVFLNDDQGTLYFVDGARKKWEHCNDESAHNTIYFLSELPGSLIVGYSYADIYFEEGQEMPKTLEELDALL